VPPCLWRPSQRISGWYILYDLFRSDLHGTNPFLPIFVDCLRQTSSNAEKLLLVHLVSSPSFAREVRRALCSHCASLFHWGAAGFDWGAGALSHLAGMFWDTRVCVGFLAPPAVREVCTTLRRERAPDLRSLPG
jgi:hypothetical protein